MATDAIMRALPMNPKSAIVLVSFLVSCGGVGAFNTAPSSPLAQFRSFDNERVGMGDLAQSTFPRPSCRRTRSLAAAPLEVIDPSYNLALGSLALGAAFGVPGSPLKSKLSSFLGGIPLALFGLFLAFQTTTLRFTFDQERFSLVQSNLESIGENVVVGGENSWAYDKFVNYDFLSFPILVYFKETQTPEEFWNIGPGEQANSEEAIAKGAVPGQVHFFPAIGNTEQLASGFEKHGCARID
ncbi:hypothetical protein ACHAWF_001019 [Thalassiosira exigua]